jgi:hypothetical protein
MSSLEHEEWLRRRAKTRQAIGIVLDRLATLSPSVEVGHLRAAAERALETADGGYGGIPAPERQEWLLARVVALDAAMRALERKDSTGRASRRAPPRPAVRQPGP